MKAVTPVNIAILTPASVTRISNARAARVSSNISPNNSDAVIPARLPTNFSASARSKAFSTDTPLNSSVVRTSQPCTPLSARTASAMRAPAASSLSFSPEAAPLSVAVITPLLMNTDSNIHSKPNATPRTRPAPTSAKFSKTSMSEWDGCATHCNTTWCVTEPNAAPAATETVAFRRPVRAICRVFADMRTGATEAKPLKLLRDAWHGRVRQRVRKLMMLIVDVAPAAACKPTTK
mmetsp:Transcript_42991/g.71435  ORF Transcript_42991/g.71435 Transcript_42991/m.71435 type:complete len:235 (-) Transcript_42991:98-802(-)